MNDFNLSFKKCLICKGGRKNDCLYAHKDADTGEIWLWCQGKCKRGYSLYDYCNQAGISLKEFLAMGISFDEAPELEVNAMSWPRSFYALSDPQAKPGVDYLLSRGLDMPAEMYYDSDKNGIVFPYYVHNTFVGAQIRFIEPRTSEDGSPWKITTLPGTRLGYLFWGWSQQVLPTSVKYLVIAEGAINAASLQQALNKRYGNLLRNPYRCISTSGASVTQYHCKRLKELIDSGLKIIAACDNDDAGISMFEKMAKQGACTHYSFVTEEGKDWNDLLIKGDDPALHLLSKIKKA
jgi:hypothetical protein